MNLKILGCGTIIQQDTSQNCSGYLLDHNTLIDCGPGIWKALHQHKISQHDLTHIFLSHFHVDHTADLGPILLNRLLLSNLKNIPLNILGPRGLKAWFSDLKILLGRWVDDLNINILELSDHPHQIGDLTIKTRKTDHTDNSICYRIEKNNKAFFYSGDTGYNDNIISLATDCQLAVIEASNNEEAHIEDHLTPQLAGKIASRAGVKKLVLTHMYPEVGREDALRDVSRVYTGEIIIAQDGMLIDF